MLNYNLRELLVALAILYLAIGVLTGSGEYVCRRLGKKIMLARLKPINFIAKAFYIIIVGLLSIILWPAVQTYVKRQNKISTRASPPANRRF